VSVTTGPHDVGLDLLATERARRRVPARLLRLASDERLVELLRGGSEAAFEALFDRHHRGVLGFCRHMLGSVEEAEDVVQHTFLAAYRELAASDKPIQLRPWLYTIARNRCLTALRARSRQAVGELHEPPTEHLAAEVERRQDLRAVLRDVAHLPENQRAALVLSELGDMPHDEIAEVLGCRREKVKALVFQARSSLISSKTARETSCGEVRELLANLTGGSLRRNELRKHVAECAGCREFRDAVRRQRRELAVVLPVAPTVGLKAAVLGGATGGAIATKVLIVAAVVGGGTAALEVKAVVDKPAPAPREARPLTGAPPPVTAPAIVSTARRSEPVVPSDPAAHPLRDLPTGSAVPGRRPARAGAPPVLKLRIHPAHPSHPAHPVTPRGGDPAAKGEKPAKAYKPAKAERPAKAPKVSKRATPPKAAKPLKAPKASKPAKAPKPLKAKGPATDRPAAAVLPQADTPVPATNAPEPLKAPAAEELPTPAKASDSAPAA
jgi:RNA polymerase sigma factor (sigma-70 family)